MTLELFKIMALILAFSCLQLYVASPHIVNTNIKIQKEERAGIEVIEEALASCGILYQRKERAIKLLEMGYKTMNDLQRLTSETFDEQEDKDFVKLFFQSLSFQRCQVCFYGPLLCPICANRNKTLHVIEKS
jgi:hypothetical protein